MTSRNSYVRLGKRALDLSFTLLAAPVWIPLVAILSVLIRLTLGSPVFFRQIRPGFGGGTFEILKLRTMKESPDEDGEMIADQYRLTRFGRLLRGTSLDELPELINVLKGEMSLVGPRPLLMQYLDRYTTRQARRHEVLPGITGWAQVNGRNAITWEEKFEFDIWYVDNMSFWLDLKILGMTVWKVLKGEGLSAAGHATMPEFMGTPDD